MAKYGIPYMGSKDTIADDILSVLPRGKRFVDLFGGGFAMSHAALLSGKYEQVFYNELNPLLPKLIKDTLAGKYANERRWISREDFSRLKDVDGYVRYIWSFGNQGDTYLFGKDQEHIKKLGHDFVCFGKDIPGVPNIAETDMRVRRLYLQRYIKNNTGERYELQRLEQLEQLQRLERLQQLEQLQRLERLQRLQRLEINCGSYLDYQYRDGDIAYCDPPYEDTAKYDNDGFNHKQFYDWVASREYPVYFSSYKISDNRFNVVWQTEKQSLLDNSKETKKVVTEYLYCNKAENPFDYGPLFC